MPVNQGASVLYLPPKGPCDVGRLEAWKTLNRRRTGFVNGFAYPVRTAFIEESLDVDEQNQERPTPQEQQPKEQGAAGQPPDRPHPL